MQLLVVMYSMNLAWFNGSSGRCLFCIDSNRHLEGIKFLDRKHVHNAVHDAMIDKYVVYTLVPH